MSAQEHAGPVSGVRGDQSLDRDGSNARRERAEERMKVVPRTLQRWGWGALLAAIFVANISSIPAAYESLRSAEGGLSVPEEWTAYLIGLQLVFSALWCGVGALVAWRRPGDGQAAAAALFLMIFGGITFSNLLSAVGEGNGGIAPAVQVARAAGVALLILFLFRFPDGRFVPGWSRWFAAVAVAYTAAPFLAPGSVLDLESRSPLAGLAAFLILIGGAVAAQIYRYRRRSSPVQRQQTKWVVLGTACALAGPTGVEVARMAEPSLRQGAANLVVTSVIYCCFALIPLSIGIATLRHRLWDADPILTRTLVFLGLTIAVVGIYTAIVAYLGMLFQQRGTYPVSLIATGVVAVLFQPLRDRVQRLANKVVYGEREEPYRVLSQLGQRLEAAIDQASVLPTVTKTVVEGLKVPYAAIALNMGDGTPVAAETGTPVNDQARFPLIHQGESLGELRVGFRDSEESFSGEDRQLLDDLVRQAGSAAYAARLTEELRRSRESLVVAREEERRRLRGELHDGLGSDLASLTFQVGSIRRALGRDPRAAEEELEALGDNLRSTIADVRRLAHELRPPALDELGLIPALRERAMRFASDRLRVVVEAPPQLPPLSAATEAAIYRIVSESLSNVVRHAHAGCCTVRIRKEDDLVLEILDDGVGLPEGARGGVGLLSIRERASELGGRATAARRQDRGTVVQVRLPIRVMQS